MLVLFVFFAVWIPVYWLIEPSQNVSDERFSRPRRPSSAAA